MTSQFPIAREPPLELIDNAGAAGFDGRWRFLSGKGFHDIYYSLRQSIDHVATFEHKHHPPLAQPLSLLDDKTCEPSISEC